MYADLAGDASFWNKLTAIDFEVLRQAIAKGCLLCGGPLHVANYPRKPRGIPDALAEAFEERFSTCCGHCRRRCTPPSVRFLGRRVYAGAIVLLATMKALVCGAAKRTLGRWSAWWTEVLPATPFWLGLRARFMPAIAPATLPGALVQRFEQSTAGVEGDAVVAALRALAPLSSQTAARTLVEGGSADAGFTQKMRIDRRLQDPVGNSQAPPPTKT